MMDEIHCGSLKCFHTKGWSRRDLARMGVAVARGGVLSSLTMTGAAEGKRKKKGRKRRTNAWTHQTTFGSNGSGARQFEKPYGVAVSSDGKTALVADTDNDRVSVWTRSSAGSSDWAHQTTFGSTGTGASEFRWPEAVAISDDGKTALIADTINDRISVWTRSSNSSTDWTNQTTFGSSGYGPGELDQPEDVFVSGDGLTAYIADTANNRMSVWTRASPSSADWTNETTFGSSSYFDMPVGVFVSDGGRAAWVADLANHRISVWIRSRSGSTDWINQTSFGSQGSGAANFDGPSDVWVSSDGKTVWVAETRNSRISVWERSRTSSTQWVHKTNFGKYGSGAARFDWPIGLSVSGDARTVWVADTENHRISVFPSGGVPNHLAAAKIGTQAEAKSDSAGRLPAERSPEVAPRA
jgi:DNA-binding beta-propeller fold protein YncE